MEGFGDCLDDSLDFLERSVDVLRVFLVVYFVIRGAETDEKASMLVSSSLDSDSIVLFL